MERDSRVIEEFQRRRQRQFIVAGVVIVAVVGLAWSERAGSSVLGMSRQGAQIALFTVVVAAVLFSLRNWRCPQCSRYLGKSWMLRFCPGCGVPLA